MAQPASRLKNCAFWRDGKGISCRSVSQHTCSCCQLTILPVLLPSLLPFLHPESVEGQQVRHTAQPLVNHLHFCLQHAFTLLPLLVIKTGHAVSRRLLGLQQPPVIGCHPSIQRFMLPVLPAKVCLWWVIFPCVFCPSIQSCAECTCLCLLRVPT